MNGITFHPVISRRIQIFGLVLCIVLAIVSAQIPGLIPRISTIFTGTIALLLVFFRETRIDARNGLVIEVCQLFGLISVWQRKRQFHQFRGIEVSCSSNGDSDDIASTWQVALRPYSGGLIDIRQFSSAPGERSPKAETFAREMSDLMGLAVTGLAAPDDGHKPGDK